MSNTERTAIVEALNLASQRMGNRTVLFTNAIGECIGLSATEFECLGILYEHGSMPAGKLAETTGLTTGAITGLVDRLVKAGFARRDPDPHDRRRVIITPIGNTKLGQEIQRAYKPFSDAFYELAKLYSDEQLVAITDYLKRSTDMMIELGQEMRQQRDRSKP